LWNDVHVETDRPGVIAPPPLIFLISFFIEYSDCRDCGANRAPYKPATALVTSGPYHFSRNSIYLGTTLLDVGAAVSFRIIAALLTVPFALILLQFGVIQREERYLEQQVWRSIPRLPFARQKMGLTGTLI